MKTDNDDISVKEYNKISKYEDLEIEPAKSVWKSPRCYQERTNKNIDKIPSSPSLYEIQKNEL